jgi:hypothetical protein
MIREIPAEGVQVALDIDGQIQVIPSEGKASRVSVALVTSFRGSGAVAISTSISAALLFGRIGSKEKGLQLFLKPIDAPSAVVEFDAHVSF